MVSYVHDKGSCGAWWFDREALVSLGRSHAPQFAAATPFPHAVFDGLLGDERALAIASAFPSPSHPDWKRRDYAEQSARLGQLQRTGFAEVAPEVRWLLDQLCSMAFLDFLGALLDRRDLIADPHFTGAGPMATLPGGHLALHTDFNRDSARRLDRVVSAFYYVPVDWDASWGGELELWDRARTRCEVSIAPLRDRLAIVSYGADHWHGHPSPLRCPPDRFRAVIAAHYFAARAHPEDDADAHGAVWA
jgi:hypothetical protein